MSHLPNLRTGVLLWLIGVGACPITSAQPAKQPDLSRFNTHLSTCLRSLWKPVPLASAQAQAPDNAEQDLKLLNNVHAAGERAARDVQVCAGYAAVQVDNERAYPGVVPLKPEDVLSRVANQPPRAEVVNPREYNISFTECAREARSMQMAQNQYWLAAALEGCEAYAVIAVDFRQAYSPVPGRFDIPQAEAVASAASSLRERLVKRFNTLEGAAQLDFLRVMACATSKDPELLAKHKCTSAKDP